MTSLVERTIGVCRSLLELLSKGRTFSSPNLPLSERIIEIGKGDGRIASMTCQEAAHNSSQLVNQIEARISKSKSQLEHENRQLLEQVTFNNPVHIETVFALLTNFRCGNISSPL